MADLSSNDQAAKAVPGENTRQFGLRQIYLKDMSFESPNSPRILAEVGLEPPEIKLNLRTSHRDLGDGLFEVVLHVNVHALSGQQTAFLVELEQAGIFEITGFPPQQTQAIIGATCPNALFPFAREAVASIIQRGSFPQFLLQNINFAALLDQAQAKRAADATPAGHA